ncbi:hypothetical protein EC957_003050 [Mortierella hygrophila]|uniref:Uncharacterized protein n=1 Tax=Mortierella hygrophila TaxID=979708 RepID=A0A9P6K147_9FUNG|nr:hypothetical protein EC957_003050 [Mortierella hygrophila]
MSRKGAANSKFGHLFGDSDNSSVSSRESRLPGPGDLYKDPLAAFIPPITATTATTRGGSSTTKATLSPPPSATASTTTTASRGGSPPTSGPNSRSSSRLQNHSLFSSLTGGGGGSDSGSVSGGSLFDSTPTPILSAAKRDLLFGDGGGGSTNSSSSVSRRTSSPPLSRNSNTAASQQSSSRVPSPPMGATSTRTSNNTSFLDADASPLGGPLGDFSAKRKEDDDVLSPLSTAPLTRTNSQASTMSHESVQSSRSARSLDVSAVDSSVTLRSGITTKPTASATGAGAAGSAIKEAAASPLIPSSSSSSATSSLARRAVVRTSIDHSQRQTTTSTAAETSPVISDPIFNPLTATHSQLPPPPPRHSSDWSTPQSIPSTTSSQSIETFQSISRTSSPAPPAASTPASRPLLLSKNGFERDHLDSITPTSSSPSPLSKSVSMMIPADDDATAAFASDNLYSTGPALSTPSSSSILDAGFSHSRASSSNTTTSTTTGSSTIAGAAAIAAAASVLRLGVGAGTVGQPKTRSGFSLGEDVADSSNPWMNTLADSLEETKFTRESAPNIVDYTQSEAASAFSATTTLPPSLTSSSSSSIRRTVVSPRPPSLEDDIGGFQDMFAGLRSSSSSDRGSGTVTPTPSLFPPSTSSKSAASHLHNSTTATTLSLSSWNVLDAVEAAAQDPDFLGPSAIVNQSTAKVLAMMQMPKDALDKDISAQEVFDNPWE